MNPREAAALLGHCSAFDNRKPSQAAAVAWAAALHDVPFDDDTRAAVAIYYTTAPKDPDAKLWILPHHVRTLRTKIRNQRLENFVYEPPPGEADPNYLDRLRGQTRAIASGRQPAPTDRPALEGGPSNEFMAELEARGWTGMREVPDDPAADAADAARRSGPLGIACPMDTCRAAIGRPCKTPGATDKHPLGKPRPPHGARRRAAAGTPEQTAAQRAAEEDRIRAASARHLARLEEDIPDAEIVDEEAS